MPWFCSPLVLRSALAALCWLPTAALAHPRWFFSNEPVPQVALPHDGLMLGIMVVVLAFAALAVWIEGRVAASRWRALCRPLRSVEPALWYVLLASVVLAMTWNLMNGIFLAPDLSLPAGLSWLLPLLQCAVLVLLPCSVRITGLALVAVALLLPSLAGLASAIDYVFEFAGLGVALVLAGPRLSRLDAELWPAQATRPLDDAATALRVGLGLQLLVLALHDKIVQPGVTLRFVEHFPFYNFLHALGWGDFSHLHFVWFVGYCEVVLGAMLALGLANRLVMLMLVVVFCLTAWIHGLHELAGHIPIFGVSLVLLAAGSPALRTRSGRKAARAGVLAGS